MVALSGAVGGRESLKLTVKEKVLLQLGEFVRERDLAEYPIELTQKGLSENLGVRRSHIAISLKSLMEEAFAEARKGRVEGEERRQNVYTLTPKGRARADELRERAYSLEVEFESDGSINHVKVRDLLKSSRLTLIMVVNQLERGEPVRDEITIVSRPQKKLISVFCPTCKRSIEVENIYGDEQVGFDCPGCGRPYRIAPAEKVLDKGAAGRPTIGSLVAVLVVLIGIFVIGYRFLPSFIVIPLTLIVLVVALVALSRKGKRGVPRKAVIATGVIATCFIMGFGLVYLWSVVQGSIDLVGEIRVFGPVVVAVALGYVGIAFRAPSLKGEFLVASGLLLLILSFLVLYSDSLEGLSEDSTPFFAVGGVALLIISTLYPSERDGKLLASIFSVGVFLLVLTYFVLVPASETTVDAFLVGGCFTLGAVMSILWAAQRRTQVSLARQFLSGIPFCTGLFFVMLGLFMFAGEAPVAGLIEIAIVTPFVVLGIERIFDGDWMYKLPFASLVAGVVVLAVASKIMA